MKCTGAPATRCSSLYRSTCLTVANTCESCLPGFTGIIGPANTKCFNISTNEGMVGYTCIANGDCRSDFIIICGTSNRSYLIAVSIFSIMRTDTTSALTECAESR